MTPASTASRRPAAGRATVAGAVLLNLAVSPLFIWNVLADPLARELAISPARANWVFSLGLAAFSVGVLAGGALADRMAPRRLALASGAGSVAGLVLAALAPSLWLVVAGFGIIQGLAVGLGYATAVHVAGMVNRGIVMAWAVSAYAAGSAALAPLVDALLAACGRAPALLCTAVLAGIAALAAACMLPGRPTRAASPPEQRARPVANVRILVIALLWLTFGLGSAPGLAAFAFADDFTGAGAAGAVAALSLGNFGGRLIAGGLADWLGVARVLHGFCLMLTAACLALLAGDGVWLGLAALLAIGAQYGALSTLMPLVIRGAVPATIFGRVFGVVFSAWGMFGLAAPAVVAVLLEGGSAALAAVGILVSALLGWLAASLLLLQLARARPH